MRVEKMVNRTHLHTGEIGGVRQNELRQGVGSSLVPDPIVPMDVARRFAVSLSSLPLKRLSLFVAMLFVLYDRPLQKGTAVLGRTREGGDVACGDFPKAFV